MSILAGETKAWANHPAVLMWKYHEFWLSQYSAAIRDELNSRGYRWEDNWRVLLETYEKHFAKYNCGQDAPSWLEDERVADSHKASLYRKAPDYYPEFADAVLTSCHPAPYTRVDAKGRKVKTKACTYAWPTHMKEYTND